MKLAFPICIFILANSTLLGCNSPAQNGPVNNPTQNSPVRSPKEYNGQVYKGKAKLLLGELYFDVERFTSSRHLTPNDTLHFPGYDAGWADYIESAKGEQLKFSLPGNINMWINAYSLLRPQWLNGEILDLKLYRGETYIETAQPLTVYLSDSLTLTASRESIFNVRNYRDDGRTVISVAKGKLKVYGKYYNGIPTNKDIPAGTEMNLVQSPLSGGLHDFDVSKIGNWREGGKFYFDDEFTSNALEAIGRWYDAQVIYNKPAPEVKFTMTLPYRTPFDTALSLISKIVPVNLTRQGDTVYVQ